MIICLLLVILSGAWKRPTVCIILVFADSGAPGCLILRGLLDLPPGGLGKAIDEGFGGHPPVHVATLVRALLV